MSPFHVMQVSAKCRSPEELSLTALAEDCSNMVILYHRFIHNISQPLKLSCSFIVWSVPLAVSVSSVKGEAWSVSRTLLLACSSCAIKIWRMTNCMGDTTDGNSCVLGLLLSCVGVCVHFWGKRLVFFFFLSPLLPGSTWQYIGCFRFCFLQGLVQHVAHSRELIHVVE